MTPCRARLTWLALTYRLSAPPTLDSDADVTRGNLSFRNVSSGLTSQWLEGDDISVMPGLYDIDYSAEVRLPSGTVTQLKAARRSVVLPASSTPVNIVMQAYNNRIADDLVIAEVFFSGTLQSSGNQYYGDDYVKLYNNTDHVLYADGITLWESKFTTVDKYNYTPDILPEAVTVQALYTVPGSGTDHPVLPGEYFLLADTGIDHRTINPNSFDLSEADFEWYDVSTKPNNLDIDSPTVPNLDKWYCYTLSFFCAAQPRLPGLRNIAHTCRPRHISARLSVYLQLRHHNRGGGVSDGDIGIPYAQRMGCRRSMLLCGIKICMERGGCLNRHGLDALRHYRQGQDTLFPLGAPQSIVHKRQRHTCAERYQ